MSKLTDESLMPWGKYKGHAMEKVPAQYLLYIHTHEDPRDRNGVKCSADVREYINDNLDALESEVVN